MNGILQFDNVMYNIDVEMVSGTNDYLMTAYKCIQNSLNPLQRCTSSLIYFYRYSQYKSQLDETFDR